MTIANKFARRLCTLFAAFGLMLGVGVVQAQTVIYYHTDALGSPVATTNAAGVVLERTEYEPYGQVLNPPVKDGPGYTGHVSDAQTGLSYMQQRYYDPQIGRFLSMDPVTADANTGDNFNRYWYANNNPYRFTDPDGRMTDEEKSNAVNYIENNGDTRSEMSFGKAVAVDTIEKATDPKEISEGSSQLASEVKDMAISTLKLFGTVAACSASCGVDAFIGENPKEVAVNAHKEAILRGAEKEFRDQGMKKPLMSVNFLKGIDTLKDAGETLVCTVKCGHESHGQ